MKTIFTSMLILWGSISMAMPLAGDTADVPKSTPTTPVPALTLQQLQEENRLLRARIEKVENALAEENASLHYRLTMNRLMERFRDERYRNTAEEWQSLAAYNKMLGQTLLTLQSARDSQAR